MPGNNRRPSALILGGAFPSLGAARSLAAHGVPVYVLDVDASVSQFSRHVVRTFRVNSDHSDADLVDLLLNLAASSDLEGGVLFPSTDEFVRLVAQYHEPLSQHYRVTTPPWDTVQYFYDKRLTYQLAVKRGVPVPETCNPQSLDDLDSLDLAFPLVIKPAITPHLISVTKKKAYRANSLQELRNIYRMMASIMDPAEILIQELIPGRAEVLFSYFGLFQDGLPVVGFSAKRSRQHPMEFGRASTLVVTVDNQELEALAMQLLMGVRYSGLAEVEFMYDIRHGRFEFLEVNPRLWGWHTLAIRAGVDLPYMAYAQMTGEEVAVGTFREGVKWVRMITDVPTVAVEIWNGRMTLGDYLQSMHGEKEFSVFSVNDPLPFIAELFLLPLHIKQRGF